MKKFSNKSVLFSFALILLAGTFLTGCQSNAKQSSETAEKTSEQITKIYIGGANSAKPISFLDENNQLTGYDIDVLKEIDKRIPDIEFEFQPMEFTALFTGLDTKKIDIATCFLSKNKDRAEKYIFSNGYINGNSYLTVLSDRNDINSLENLKGKTVEVASGRSDEAFFNDYNEKNPDKAVKLLKGNWDAAIITKNLVDGRTDAFISSDQTRADLISKFKVELKKVGDPVIQGSAHFLIRKDEPQLKEKIDSAIQSMIDDGTLSKISIKWWNEDYTKNISKD